MPVRRIALAATVAVLASACTGTNRTTFVPDDPVPVADGRIVVDLGRPTARVSPLIRGVSASAGDFAEAGVTFNSWGGDRASRYNYQLGNAWNQGRAGAFRNTGVADTDDLVGDWLAENTDIGVRSRVAVPALGWIAVDRDPTRCSFPDGSGGCLTVDSFDCAQPGLVPNPNRANVVSTPRTVAEWVEGYVAGGADIDYVAVDNAPERWGVEHFDVHPTCTTYDEVVDTYLSYAAVLRGVAPEAQLTGPVMCCWFGDANAPGPADPGAPDGSDRDLLDWFLGSLAAREDPATPERLIDVVDVHFEPHSDVVNSRDDVTTNAARLAAVRELWDPAFVVDPPDEPIDTSTTTTSVASEPDEVVDPVEFIPSVRRTIDEHYPNLPLMVSRWGFGNTGEINGALTIAKALGVFAREGVEAAAHTDTIEPRSPGWFAFKMYGDYDNRGGAFEGTAFEVGVIQLPNIDAYAALGDDDVLRVVIVNSSSDVTSRVRVDFGRVGVLGKAQTYTYAATELTSIARATLDVAADEIAELVPESITMLAIPLVPAVDGG